MDHLDPELLSALADGELDLSAARNAREHLAACDSCSAQIAAFRGLDQVLAAPALLTCDAATELRSALLDGELSGEEAAVAVAHLTSCESCSIEQAAWVEADTALRAMPPAVPSAATDARIARLSAPSARPRGPLAGPAALRPLALRGAAAAAVVLAILVGLLPAGAPEQARPAPEVQLPLVAGVQQVVLYAPTNTLYVINPPAASVDALDASSYALRARIAVGGRPSALALNEPASRVIVLDSSQRSLTEIDAQSNTVVATTEIAVSGTLTSVRVDPASGQIIVAAIPDPPTGGSAPTPTVGSGTPQPQGVVAVLDPTTKKVESVRSVEVAPTLVVTDASGKTKLLVSGSATTLVDRSYKTLKTLPGGVAAAFGRGDLIAVLSPDAGNAILHFNGDGAPGPLRLTGVPLALTAVPGVGFGVLLGSGSGNGRVIVVDEAGRAVGVSDVDSVGGDLAYDPSARRFTVVRGGAVASAPLPRGIVAGATPVPEESEPPRSPSPAPSRSAEPSPSAPPSPSPSPSVRPSDEPVAAPSAPVAAASPKPTLPIGIPSVATSVKTDLYRIDLGGRVPVLTAATLRKIWFLDSRNGLNALDVANGAVFPIAQIPRDAEISAIAVGATGVYAADAKKGRLFTLDIASERLSSRDLPFLHGAMSMVVAPDGTIWIAADDSAHLLTIDPRTERVAIVDTGLSGVAAIAIDGSSRLWFVDGGRWLGSYDLGSRQRELTLLPGRGAAHVLLPDPSGSVWVGTTAGEVISVKAGVVDIVASLRHPVSALAIDTAGVAWYLTPERGGFIYGRLDRAEAQFTIPGPASSIAFTLGRRAWLADPAGGFYVSAEPSR